MWAQFKWADVQCIGRLNGTQVINDAAFNTTGSTENTNSAAVCIEPQESVAGSPYLGRIYGIIAVVSTSALSAGDITNGEQWNQWRAMDGSQVRDQLLGPNQRITFCRHYRRWSQSQHTQEPYLVIPVADMAGLVKQAPEKACSFWVYRASHNQPVTNAAVIRYHAVLHFFRGMIGE